MKDHKDYKDYKDFVARNPIDEVQVERDSLLWKRGKAVEVLEAWSRSQRTCWYCGVRPPDESCQRTVIFRAEGHSVQSTDWERMTTTTTTPTTQIELVMPRCTVCRDFHVARHDGNWLRRMRLRRRLAEERAQLGVKYLENQFPRIPGLAEMWYELPPLVTRSAALR